MIVKLAKKRARRNERIITGLTLIVEETTPEGHPHPDVYRQRRICREIAEAFATGFETLTLKRNGSAVLKKEL